MLKASARYHLKHHYAAKDDAKKAHTIASPISNIIAWQYTGPFDNISDSGFDKNYPPIDHPQPDARFKSTNNSDIKWFTPNAIEPSGWQIVASSIKWDAGIIYAQSFVSAPADMDVILASGFTGKGCKIWVNDALIFSDREKRKTDFDVFSAPCQLKKGVNRVLFQLGLFDGDFTNFSARFLTKDGGVIQGLASSAVYAPYPTSTVPFPTPLPFFAEQFFEEKIKSAPKNLLNYYLLCETYLRALKSQEALDITTLALALAPDNILFRYQRLLCLIKLGNRTALSQEIEDFKRIAPEHLISIVYQYDEAVRNEKFDEAQELLDRWEKLCGKNASIYEKRIKLLLQRQKIQEAIPLIAEAYKVYPLEPYFANLTHDVELKLNKKPEAAIGVYTSFLRKYNYANLAFALATDYINQGMGAKAVDIYEKIEGLYPQESGATEKLLYYYLNIQDAKKAKVFSDKLLAMAPFHGTYWEDAAKISELAGNKQEALSNFQQALHYNPNDYDVRRQIRELQGKPDFTTLMPAYNPFELYKKTKTTDKEGEFDWYYILDDHCAILYPERNSELYATLVIKILNEAGIDYWKEASISYDDSQQRLIVEKAEILKPNGSRITAEQNGAQLVMPNLQVGDGIHIRYRLANYAFGRMAREFTAATHFNAFVPTDITRYSLFVPTNMPVNIKNINQNYTPTVTELKAENLLQYTWEILDEPAIIDQRLMPATADIAKVVHISTIPDWNDIATWYGDISGAQAKRDPEVQLLAKEIMPTGNTMSQSEKARAIYDWIVKNIRYSSIPFRQSGYVPQRAAKVIQTKLGDCKDLATLFAALAREVGMTANLVLVNTRDQGTHAMELPCMEFNHCIVRVIADAKVWYLELTDPELPFGGLPGGDINAFVLEIPFGKNDDIQQKPFLLNPQNRLKDTRRETTTIEIKGRDLLLETTAIQSGAIASTLRSDYKDLPQAKRIEEVQGFLAKKFTNPLIVKNLNFGDLKTLSDTAQFNVLFTVKNEVLEIGQLNTIKVPFHDIIFNASSFPEETRIHPLSYWEYEDTDHYHEEITVNLPAGKTFSEVPKDVLLTFKEMKYSLKYTLGVTGSLKIVREIDPKRVEIAAQDYELFRAFTEAVINAELRMIAFK